MKSQSANNFIATRGEAQRQEATSQWQREGGRNANGIITDRFPADICYVPSMAAPGDNKINKTTTVFIWQLELRRKASKRRKMANAMRLK